MKKHLQKILFIGGIGMALSTSMKAQTVSTFESLNLSGTYWDGSSAPLGTTFTDGNAIFPNYYDTAFGGFWANGWAYSNMVDSTTAGYMNIYAARPGIGYGGSAKYAVGQNNAMINLTGTASGKVANGFYITNGTFAAISMKDGDSFAKKFGGVSGNDPDWFKLTVRKYFGGVMTNDSVEFYLADYRFLNNSQDYIVKNWQWVDLTSLGNVDSLVLKLSSSDASAWGMNTPAFFCMDNFTTADSPLKISEIESNNLAITLFPNPSSDNITINLENLKSEGAVVQIIDAKGNLVYKEIANSFSFQIPVAHLSNGIYYLKVTGNNFEASKAFTKQ